MPSRRRPAESKFVVADKPTILDVPGLAQIAEAVPRRTGAVEDTGLLFQSPQSFRAALLVIAPAVPFVATITTLLIYLAPLQAGMPLWLLWIKGQSTGGWYRCRPARLVDGGRLL